MTTEQYVTTPDVYDRIYLKIQPDDPRNMVIEYLEGYLGPDAVDEWRLIDLTTGHVIAKDPSLHEVIHIANRELYPDDKPDYVYEVEKRDYRKFKDIPLKDRMRYIASNALDLEHDARNDASIENPIIEATKMLYDTYDYPCFFDAGDGTWELDMDIAQGR